MKCYYPYFHSFTNVDNVSGVADWEISGYKGQTDASGTYEEGDVRLYSTIMENGNKYPEFWTEYTFPGQTAPGYVYYDGAVSYGDPMAIAMSIRKHLQGRDNSKDVHITEMHCKVRF